MDIQVAILSLYFLFPNFSSGQAKLEASVKGVALSAAERLDKRMEIKNFLALEKLRWQSENEDDELKPEEIFGDIGDLENPLYGPQSEGSALDDINAAEVFYTNSMERLALFEYGEEEFVSPKALCGRNTIVNVNDDIIVRTEYDDFYRTLERTVWKNESSVSASTIITRTRYTYPDEKTRIPKFCGQEYLDEGRYVETKYNYAGKPTEIVDYGVKKTDSGGASRILKKKNTYTYDVELRLAMETENENFEDGTSKSSKKIYTYSAVSKIPSVSYYENNELRIQTDYKAENDYVQTIFFDGNYKISAEYKDNEKISEIVFLNDVEVSRRSFE